MLEDCEQGQKMLDGQLYNATDKTLSTLRKQAKLKCAEFNNADLSDNKLRVKLQQNMMPNAKGIWVEPNFFCDYGVNIYSHSGVFVNHNVVMLDGAPIKLGDKVLIGPNCVLASTTHPSDTKLRAKGLCISKPITLKNNVWLGANVTVLGGVTIGEGAIIGAGVTVRHDVAAGAVLT